VGVCVCVCVFVYQKSKVSKIFIFSKVNSEFGQNRTVNLTLNSCGVKRSNDTLLFGHQSSGQQADMTATYSASVSKKRCNLCPSVSAFHFTVVLLKLLCAQDYT